MRIKTHCNTLRVRGLLIDGLGHAVDSHVASSLRVCHGYIQVDSILGIAGLDICLPSIVTFDASNVHNTADLVQVSQW